MVFVHDIQFSSHSFIKTGQNPEELPSNYNKVL